MTENSLHLERINSIQNSELTQFEDRTIYQTLDWLKFVSISQKAEPVIAIIKKGDQSVGLFTGLIIKKWGMRILGSPFPGWTTSYMGFNLDPSVSRRDALVALERYAFDELKCIHIEILDRRMKKDDFSNSGFNYRIVSGFEIDLTQDEEKIFLAMKSSSCRYSMRKAEKEGVQIEVANDLEFVNDYYSQLEDVFAKQKLVPTYTKDRVRLMIEHILPTGNLLLLRARDKSGNCIATGIFPSYNDTMYLWGAASWRSYQSLCPNEAIQWFAIKFWKSKGIAKYDLGGGGEYKRKYGGYEISVPWGRKSKYSLFEKFRNNGKNIFTLKQRILGLIKK